MKSITIDVDDETYAHLVAAAQGTAGRPEDLAAAVLDSHNKALTGDLEGLLRHVQAFGQAAGRHLEAIRARRRDEADGSTGPAAPRAH